MIYPVKSIHPDLSAHSVNSLGKIPTGIEGVDEVLDGGLPSGRTTLVSGGPGTGKTVFGVEFLYRSALSGNPGIFLSFEEPMFCIRENAGTFGWDLAALEAAGQLFLLEGQVGSQILTGGDFNLKGLLAILVGKVKEMGADRIVIDALDMLLRFFKDYKSQQDEVITLHRWLFEQRVTTLLTVKSADDRHEYSNGYLDYLADCVVALDQRISEQVATKRLQVVKYRGSKYSSNEHPFFITGDGFKLMPITAVENCYISGLKKVSSGNPALDDILGGGYQSGSAILISGMTGTGKTALASTFVQAAAQNGQKVLYVTYEESKEGLIAGMNSLGLDLQQAGEDNALRILSSMPESMGIEAHLFQLIGKIQSFSPGHLVIDAISACTRIAGEAAAFDFFVRLINICKCRGTTIFLINQARHWDHSFELSGFGVSSVIDTIISLQFEEEDDKLGRRLMVLKSRGARHSHRYHPFRLSDHGLEIDDGSN